MLSTIRTALLSLLCLGLIATAPLHADSSAQPGTPAPVNDTIKALKELAELQSNLRSRIRALGRQIRSSESNAEKKKLQARLDKTVDDLQTITNNFENLAAGTNIASLKGDEQKKFNLQEEVLSLIKPVVKEVKDLTRRVRKKTELKEKISYYSERIPIAQKAVDNIGLLLEQTNDDSLASQLDSTRSEWKSQLNFYAAELQAAQLELRKLTNSEVSVAEASQSYLKNFFHARGLYLAQAIGVVAIILLLSRLSHRLLVRMIPGYRKEHRSFRLRLLDLTHRMITLLLVTLGPMVVFYMVEDWVLFSLGVLLLFGIGWTLRQTLPRYWHQVQLFLNIGAVREGERIFMDGLPWRVKVINIYSILDNPTAGISQRIPINRLVDLKSRPTRGNEPWFPCRKGDWVILSDGQRGKVISISPEMVEMVERGGAHRNYLTQDFLSLSPKNISISFRLKETLGISYQHQSRSTHEIPDTLARYIEKRIRTEGYGEQCLNLRVEFQAAADSSLELVVIADFKGELAELYNRLRRAIQRWCVDACSENGWEIPFPQLTIHASKRLSHQLLEEPHLGE